MPPSPRYLMVFAAAASLGLLAVFLVVQRLLDPEHAMPRALAKGNTARALLQVGHVLGVCFVAESAVAGCVQGKSVAEDALWVGVFGAAGVAVLELSGRLGVRVLLRAKLPAEIERGNAAAGLAAGAHYLATGIITARSIAGSDLPTLGLSLVFFALGQLCLHVFLVAFRALTSYDDSEEILGQNVAAALSYAGLTVGVAIIIGHAVEGSFLGWGASLRAFGGALIYILALYPVRQIVVQTMLIGGGFSLHKGRLDEGVGRERNVGMGALEASAYIAAALAIVRFA